MQQLNDIINYLNPEQEHCKLWSIRISNFNKLIFLSLVLGNIPSVLGRLNNNVKDKFWIIVIHFCVWIILPLIIGTISKTITVIYDFLNKNYIFQLIVSIILIILVVFTYSKDLAGKL